MLKEKKISIIGTGAYGTALALFLSKNGYEVILWSKNAKYLRELKKERKNKFFFPNIRFPKNLKIGISLAMVASFSKNILIVVPSQKFKRILQEIKPFLKKNSRIVWATKGLEKNTGRLLQEVAEEILGKNIPLAFISGPTFAHEVAVGLPTSIVVSSKNKKFREDLKEILCSEKYFLVYKTSDFIGVQICGVVKNIIAIGSGISDGIGLGSNAKAFLITQGFSEMVALGTAMGAIKKTFFGVAGIGDLVLTCTTDHSRNRSFGILIGKGNSIKKSKRILGKTVEGYNNIKEVLILSKRYNINMPIVKQIYKILYRKKNAKNSLLSLMYNLKIRNN
ncbi:NAD(P)H-dependent glycerol-3-phosphate dehydrogenase [bacterium endosymbiont of Pedicinus badii]|uniref:NAD(P)H-dependent glycerol-3-phosphate dehydrogenase n=1 Tax=bacterium endosymbiont of Pedicinus badii TaxID=1719126 RepID=UPI0009BBFBC1|nr:NAD(P)H-dependent glycerol-3-phosphate dehydrogenase [bacterium endosymbiont of Pedicinus badii]OQM34056.1 glycerol-3-phosphate dehydrogenase [bacterium endosymbiont of Pedicinus badii]